MLLSELITPDCIKIGLEAEDKEEVFEELVDFMVNVHDIPERETILDALRVRETKGTTGIGGGVAIPHAKSGIIDRSYVVLGISNTGIDYQATDNEPVFIIFLFITQESNPGEHLKILQKIAKLSKDNEIIESLKDASDEKQVHKIIVDFEEQEV
jgi:PTS system fructose-specific IIC component/PTS system nitrogen regulatory IIA component